MSWWNRTKPTRPAAAKPLAKSESKAGKADQYEAKKEAENERNKRRSHASRNIGPCPPVKNPARKARALKSGEHWLKDYFPKTFFLPFSPDHRSVIKLADQIIDDGGMQATAMPRGSGKTSIFERLAMRAIFFGLRRFCLILGSNTEAAEDILATIQVEILTNELLAEDFPEIVHPFRALEQISNRAKGQHIDGIHTNPVWHKTKLVLPTVAGSPASGGVLIAKGILARIRGLKLKANNGGELRPDLVLPDDPQTDNSARSEYQIGKRLKVMRGTVLGLAGPGSKIAAFCPCTVIEPNDLADQLLNREACPEWHGQKIPLMRSMPTNKKLWEEYYEIRADELRADKPPKKATAFYRKNRLAMDKGGESTWAERFDPDEISATQNAMNLIQDRGQQAFDAEFQQTPTSANSADISTWFLTADRIAKKIWLPPAEEMLPLWATNLVGFIDLQQRLLYWAVGVFGTGFRGHVVEYGTWPRQTSPFFTYAKARQTIASQYPGKGINGGLTAALKDLANYLEEKRYHSGTTDNMHIEKVGTDTGWKGEIVHTVAREWKTPGFLLPAKGVPVQAHNRPFAEYTTNTGDINGHHWRDIPNKRHASRLFHIDTNYWKTRVHQGFATAEGDPESFTLPAGTPDKNGQLITHCRSENPTETWGQGRQVFVWTLPPNAPDNHWFDCLTGLMAMASRVGISTGTGDSTNPVKRTANNLTADQIAAYNERARQRRYARR